MKWCQDIRGIGPIDLDELEDTIVCGKRGGSDYLDVEMARSDGSCPTSGQVNCNPKSSSEKQVCAASSNDCPVTDLILDASMADKKEGYTTLKGKKFNVHYTKTSNSLPLTDFRIEEDLPCFNRDQENEGPYKSHYVLEADYSLQDCTIEPNNKLASDPRYSEDSTYTISMFKLQYENGVI